MQRQRSPGPWSFENASKQTVCVRKVKPRFRKRKVICNLNLNLTPKIFTNFRNRVFFREFVPSYELCDEPIQMSRLIGYDYGRRWFCERNVWMHNVCSQAGATSWGKGMRNVKFKCLRRHKISDERGQVYTQSGGAADDRHPRKEAEAQHRNAPDDGGIRHQQKERQGRGASGSATTKSKRSQGIKFDWPKMSPEQERFFMKSGSDSDSNRPHEDEVEEEPGAENAPAFGKRGRQRQPRSRSTPAKRGKGNGKGLRDFKRDLPKLSPDQARFFAQPGGNVSDESEAPPPESEEEDEAGRVHAPELGGSDLEFSKPKSRRSRQISGSGHGPGPSVVGTIGEDSSSPPLTNQQPLAASTPTKDQGQPTDEQPAGSVPTATASRARTRQPSEPSPDSQSPVTATTTPTDHEPESDKSVPVPPERQSKSKAKPSQSQPQAQGGKAKVAPARAPASRTSLPPAAPSNNPSVTPMPTPANQESGPVKPVATPVQPSPAKSSEPSASVSPRQPPTVPPSSGSAKQEPIESVPSASQQPRTSEISSSQPPSGPMPVSQESTNEEPANALALPDPSHPSATPLTSAEPETAAAEPRTSAEKESTEPEPMPIVRQPTGDEVSDSQLPPPSGQPTPAIVIQEPSTTQLIHQPQPSLPGTGTSQEYSSQPSESQPPVPVTNKPEPTDKEPAEPVATSGQRPLGPTTVIEGLSSEQPNVPAASASHPPATPTTPGNKESAEPVPAPADRQPTISEARASQPPESQLPMPSGLSLAHQKPAAPSSSQPPPSVTLTLAKSASTVSHTPENQPPSGPNPDADIHEPTSKQPAEPMPIGPTSQEYSGQPSESQPPPPSELSPVDQQPAVESQPISGQLEPESAGPEARLLQAPAPASQLEIPASLQTQSEKAKSLSNPSQQPGSGLGLDSADLHEPQTQALLEHKQAGIQPSDADAPQFPLAQTAVSQLVTCVLSYVQEDICETDCSKIVVKDGPSSKFELPLPLQLKGATDLEQATVAGVKRDVSLLINSVLSCAGAEPPCPLKSDISQLINSVLSYVQEDICETDCRKNSVMEGQIQKLPTAVTTGAGQELGMVELKRATHFEQPPSRNESGYKLAPEESSVLVMVQPRLALSVASVAPSRMGVRVDVASSASAVNKMTYGVVDSDASFLDVNYHKMKAERGESSIHKNRTDINLIAKPGAGLGAGASPNQAPPIDISGSTAPPSLSIGARMSMRENLQRIRESLDDIRKELKEHGLETPDPPSKNGQK